MFILVKSCEFCANNEIVVCCDVAMGHVGRAVGDGGPGPAAGDHGDAAGARAS